MAKYSEGTRSRDEVVMSTDGGTLNVARESRADHLRRGAWTGDSEVHLRHCGRRRKTEWAFELQRFSGKRRVEPAPRLERGMLHSNHDTYCGQSARKTGSVGGGSPGFERQGIICERGAEETTRAESLRAPAGVRIRELESQHSATGHGRGQQPKKIEAASRRHELDGKPSSRPAVDGISRDSAGD